MKRFLALLITATIILSFSACGNNEDTDTITCWSCGETISNTAAYCANCGSAVADNPNNTEPSTTESTNNPTGGTEDSTQDSTEGTTGDTTNTTEPSTTTPPTTEAPHTHSYSSKVTTAATCGKDGVKTFTCSCGDSYTEKIAATGQHSWSSWKTETCALVNRKGTDKRTCPTCSASETRDNTENVLENSFYDPGLQQLFYNGFNYDGSLRAYSLLAYAPYRYSKFAYKENSTDTIYDTLAKSFVLDSSFKDKMRAEGKSNPYYLGYNEANDTFTFEGNSMGSTGYAEPLGYIHNGGNQYTVYYRFEENGGGTAQIYKVVLEFKRTDRFDTMDWKLNGEENKYLSFEKVSSVPNNLTK